MFKNNENNAFMIMIIIIAIKYQVYACLPVCVCGGRVKSTDLSPESVFSLRKMTTTTINNFSITPERIGLDFSKFE